jgi:hypothetical protein
MIVPRDWLGTELRLRLRLRLRPSLSISNDLAFHPTPIFSTKEDFTTSVLTIFIYKCKADIDHYQRSVGHDYLFSPV